MRGNLQALFGKRPTEKDPAKGTSPAVDFTREEAAAEKDQHTWHLARRPTSPPSAPRHARPHPPKYCASP